MMMLPRSVRIFIAREPTDMRKGHDGLAALVQNSMKEDLFSGHLFVFLSKQRNRIKILTWDRGGLVVWYKRLEKGRLKMPRIDDGAVSLELDSGELSMLLEGLDLNKVRRPRRWEPSKAASFSSMATM